MAMPSVNESTNPTGLYFVPQELTNEVNQLIRDGGCVEGFARHFPMTRLQLVMRKFATGVDGYWVDAMAVKTKDAPTFETVTLNVGRFSGDAEDDVGYLLETPSILSLLSTRQSGSEKAEVRTISREVFATRHENPSTTTRRPLTYFPYCKVMI